MYETCNRNLTLCLELAESERKEKKRKERNIGEKWKKYGKKILLYTELEFVNFLSSSLKTKQWKVIFLKLPLLPFLSQNTTNIF